MAMKTQVESLDDVPEAVRTEYKESLDPVTKAKVYVLDIEGPVEVLPGVRGLKDEAARRRIENTNLTKTVAKFSVLGERDPNEIVALLDRIPELELAAKGKLDDAAINGLVETRIKSRIAPLEREIGGLKTQVAEKDTKIGEYSAAETRRKVSSALSRAARDLKVLDTAVDDVEMYGDRIFEVQEDGAVVTKDGVGVIPGLSPKLWLEDMQTKRPHWWGPTAGGGAPGSRNGLGPSGSNPWAAETWNMTEQGKIVQADRARADKLAKEAGTTVGGLRPKVKAK